MKTLQVYRPGLIAYDVAFVLQEQLLARRIAGDIPDTLILLEHPPTLTLAKGADQQNILVPEQVLKDRGVAVHPTDRGGNITLHGPGQIVGYPILHLDGWENDIHQYIRNIEQVIMKTLSAYGIESRRDAEHVGVWVGDEKIAAIGVKVKKWVTKHGFALNVNTDLTYFDLINPCGIADKGVTSMKRLLQKKIDLNQASERIIRDFGGVFGVEPEIMPDVAAMALFSHL